ncbi:hypothetical protein N7492_004108 [Penicillium capsulatum]|uniref:Protein kinase domain-containing protein n=1 Tax=Penicillium capsulatum TaxID=69766 RepID=A0A9W9IKQ5_9EURO|nr:hypothetical protein N7492_004108 [Penicillium capsulatum]KAJ6121319.1 hypothetical protein N7512_003784 [Penicillium capsulatum]
MAPGHSDLVADTKIRVEFDADITYRFTIQSGASRRRVETKELWKTEKRIGQGISGSVWLHRRLAQGDPELQAVKKIDKSKLESHKVDWYKELEAIAKFSQQKYRGLFVDYIGWYETDDFAYIAMEYIEHGSLDNYLKESLPEVEAREITRQIAEGLCDLHANNFVHRDLKPANIMVVQKAPEWWVKIGDFGISKRVNEDTSLKTSVGTRLFMAPEAQMIYPPDVEDNCHYTEQVDIWSLGVLVYYMLFHLYPFTVDNKFLPKYVRGAPLPFPHPPDSLVCDFFNGSLAANASKRMSAKDVLECDWLQQSSTQLDGLAHQMTNLEVQDQEDETMSIRTMSTIETDEAWDIAQETTREPAADWDAINATERRRPEVPQVIYDESKTARYMPTSDSTPASKSLNPTHRRVASTKRDETLLRRMHDQEPVNGRVPLPFVGIPPSNDYSSEEETEDPGSASFNEGVKCFYRQEVQQALAHFQTAVRENTAKFGTMDTRTSSCQHALGMTYYNLQQYMLAAEWLKAAVAGWWSAFGPTHYATLSSAYSASCSFWMAKDYPRAELEFKALLGSYQNTYGSDSAETNEVLFYLADALLEQNKHEEAEEVLKRCLEWQNRHHGPFHQTTLYAQGHLGTSLMTLERYEEATPVIEANVQALQVAEGPDAPTTIFMIHKLGLVLLRLDKTREAAVWLQKVVDVYRRGLPDTGGEEVYLDSLFRLGTAYSTTKDYKESESLLKEAAERQKAEWGICQKTLPTLYRLGIVQFHLKKYRDASKTLQETVEGQRIVLGSLHADTLEAMYWLGYSFRYMKKDSQAKGWFREAFEGQKEVFGFANYDTLQSLVALSKSLFSLQQYKEAEASYFELIDGWTRYRGPNHKDTLTAVYGLGRAQYKDGNYVEAEKTLRRLVETEKSISGRSRTSTLDAMESLGWTLFRLNKYEEGEVVVRELLKRRKKKLGAEATETIDSTRALALHLESQSKFDEAAPLLNQVLLARRKTLGHDHSYTKQSEKEYRRCYRMARWSDNYGSDDSLSSISSSGADIVS